MTVIECPRCHGDTNADRVDATVPPRCARCSKCGHVFAVAEAARFDPYHTWLGIPPQEQPPTHYRLLGLALFECNASVIDNAADGRMAHLRSLTTGPRASQAVSLLNQVAAARICLLDAGKKDAYDAELKSRTARTDQPPMSRVVPPRHSPPEPQPKQSAELSDRPLMSAPPPLVPFLVPADVPTPIPTTQSFASDRTSSPTATRRRARAPQSRNTNSTAILMSVFGGACGILFGYLLLYEYIPRVVSQQTRSSTSRVEPQPARASTPEPLGSRTPRRSNQPLIPPLERKPSPRREPRQQQLPLDESDNGSDLAIDRLPPFRETDSSSSLRPQAAIVPPLTFTLNKPTVDRVFNVNGMHKGDRVSLEVTGIDGLIPGNRLDASNRSVVTGGTLTIKVESVPSAELRIDTTPCQDGVIGVGVRMVAGNSNSTVPILLTRDALDKEITRIKKRIVDIRQDLAKDEQQQERLNSQMNRRNKTVGPDDRQAALRAALKKIADAMAEKQNELKQLETQGEATLKLAEDIASSQEVTVQFKITAESPTGPAVDLVVSRR